MVYLYLFWEFFKVGLFAVGGGLVAIPFIQDIANRYPAWIDPGRMSDMIAVSESTPGPIGINMATYAGYNAAGIPGAVIATFSLVLPAFLIVIVIYRFLEAFSKHHLVRSAFHTLRPAVIGMICAAGIDLFLKSAVMINGATFISDGAVFLNLPALILFASVLFLLQKTKLHPVVYIAGGALAGVLLKM
jgi:chromate transporter